MSSGDTPVNMARLLTTFNIEVRALPDDLKCVHCKSVLKDACQVPCGCRFCRTCIDGLMVKGSQFCPGGSQECGRTPLSPVQRDFSANRSIMKLTAKCPHAGCTHECPLADMEGHLRMIHEQNMGWPFSPFDSLKSTLTAGRVSDHVHERGSHSETLIGMATKRDIEMLKLELVQKDQQMKDFGSQFKSIKDEIKSMKDEIKSVKNENKAIKDENKSIREENESMKNDIRSIKIENESIKGGKEVLSERVRRLEEKMERERDGTPLSDKRVSAGIGAVTRAAAPNLNMLGIEMKPVRGDIRMKQFDSMRCQMGSIQVPVGLGPLNNWLINEDLSRVQWGWTSKKTSGRFSEDRRSYTYELTSINSLNKGNLKIWLRIWAGPSDAQLQWPFRGAVTITVAHRDNAEKCMRETQQCQIERPADNEYSYASDPIIFPHAALREAGLDLDRGVHVSCHIVLGVPVISFPRA